MSKTNHYPPGSVEQLLSNLSDERLTISESKTLFSKLCVDYLCQPGVLERPDILSYALKVRLFHERVLALFEHSEHHFS